MQWEQTLNEDQKQLLMTTVPCKALVSQHKNGAGCYSREHWKALEYRKSLYMCCTGHWL